MLQHTSTPVAWADGVKLPNALALVRGEDLNGKSLSTMQRLQQTALDLETPNLSGILSRGRNAQERSVFCKAW